MIDKKEYPFKPQYIHLPDGRMHYIDEGKGEAIVMVHGTPAWSFLYRNLIKNLSGNYRVIAPDHIGFGLSDKPDNWSARPADHARNLETLIERLGLKNITLAVHDFGGPIGLSYAINRPENVSRLILFNTWIWSVDEDKNIVRGSRLFGGLLGKLLYQGLNFSPKFLLPQVFGDKTKLTPEIHRHYTDVFPAWRDRHTPWVLAGELATSGEWFNELWNKRERIKNKPALILWGMKDPMFKPDYLQRWREFFTDAEIVEFPRAGHFVQEEATDEVMAHIKEFLAKKNMYGTIGCSSPVAENLFQPGSAEVLT